MNSDFTVKDHGAELIDLRHLGAVIPMRPTELHHKVDGSIEDGPVFCIVMTAPNLNPVYGQISLKMLGGGLREIGYDIIRVESK